MAKRKKISAPSPEALQAMEDGFARAAPAPSATGAMAPIAQIAGETAYLADPLPAQSRRDTAEAEAYRTARDAGRIVLTLALDDIDDDAMIRDRTVLDAQDLDELKGAIAAHGLRAPIEVFAQDGPRPYGLLSGYRRLRAFRDLAALTNDPAYASIPAFIRDPEAMGGAFAAMVEENEIRSALSHFERGRIAVIAAQQGAFVSSDAAVASLFSQASKAKRSKIRSFAVIFEELGDCLAFPELLKEREGLRLATALRGGAERALRTALDAAAAQTPDQEWAALKPVIEASEAALQDSPRRGRPRSTGLAPGWHGKAFVLDSGITLRRAQDATGHTIRLEGAHLTPALVEAAMERLAYLLDTPD